MTRDLPFDDDTEGAERAGDTAYRVATGVARVARAGAYVTGGALVAANGGGVPAQPGESRLDSWHTGWAHSTDPDPDQPSPVITFPDPVVEPAPFSSHGSNTPVAHGNPAPGSVGPAPAFTLPSTGAAPSLPTLGDDYSGTDAGFPLPTLAGGEAGGHAMQLPGHSGNGVPGLGGIPGTEGSGSGLTIPGTEGHVSHGPALPGTRSEASNDLDAPGGHGFGLPGHGLGQAGHGFGLPGSNGFVAPGSTVFDLPGGNGVGAAPAAGDPFDGVGQGGGDLGAFVGTQWQVDFGIGPNGIYFTSEMKVDVGVGHVGDQLDEYTDWLADGIRIPDGTDHTAEQDAPGHGHSGLLGALTSPGSSATQSSAASGVAQSPSAGAAQPSASSVVQPLSASAPVAPAGTVAPVASVAPAVPAPAPAPAAVAAAPVVAATPLQTTIQPDVASTPIANVLAAPEGPSVLTAPAAAVPALFDAVRPAPAVKPYPVSDPQPTHPTHSPTATVPTPTTIVKTTPTPSGPGDATAPSAPKTPDLDITKTPGVTTAPHGGITTAPDLPTTKTPGATVTQTPAPTHAPTTPDDDVTTPGGGTGRPSTGGTSHSTYPTDDLPSHELPTGDVPTVSRPAQPTYSAPDQPTYSAPAQAPTVEPHAPTYTAPVPTQAPIKPQVIDPKPHGIAAPLAADPVAGPGFAAHDYDHSALLSAGGLSSALLPEPAMPETHHYASDVSDISLI
ncbi:hypothetical protein [Nocardia sputorum]|uniref:Uncharacterized protein n=1 Tax=Nocardia sputorum TaxID=2984338 RepID=A0ABM8D311_9NOCA|nr:hypothetical protein [Nocardia sputorum]BDU01777.1 hypothetical protein IFM12276_48050 [Nocardia sputorum]